LLLLEIDFDSVNHRDTGKHRVLRTSQITGEKRALEVLSTSDSWEFAKQSLASFTATIYRPDKIIALSIVCIISPRRPPSITNATAMSLSSQSRRLLVARKLICLIIHCCSTKANRSTYSRVVEAYDFSSGFPRSMFSTTNRFLGGQKFQERYL
jgi:hypothetical protein